MTPEPDESSAVAGIALGVVLGVFAWIVLLVGLYAAGRFLGWW